MTKDNCIAGICEHAPTVRNESAPNPTSGIHREVVSREILAAVVAALGKVKTLTKSERNESAGYAFSSIDSFLALVNPICAETGLIVLMDETLVEDIATGPRSGGDAWLRISYEITLAHVSGQMLGPFRRHVDVPRSGPQAYGAAQSYVLKQFLRAQFQIATGETDDPDFGARARAGNLFDQPAARKNPASKGGQDQAAALDDNVVTQLASRIASAKSGRELHAILGGLSDECLTDERLTAARLAALRRIVSSTASLAALDLLERYFSPDWPKIRKEADRRRRDLVLLVNQAEESAAIDAPTGAKHPTDRAAEIDVIMESGNPALLSINADIPVESDFGVIPYSEAAA